MTEMYTLNICLVFLLVFVHNVTPKVFLIDLTDEGSGKEKPIKLQELFDIFKKPEAYKKLKVYENGNIEEEEQIKDMIRLFNDEDCLKSAEKQKCLEKYQENNIIPVGRGYPNQDSYPQRPKRTVLPPYNFNRGVLTNQQFPDFMQKQFSQDYLDVGDLSRMEPKCRYPECRSPELSHYFKRKLSPDRVSDKKPLRLKRNIDRRVFERYSSDESTSSDSSDSESTNDRKDRKHRKPNRFQVVFNEDSVESEEVKPKKKLLKSFSSESEEKKKPDRDSDEERKPVKLQEKYSYLQGNKLYDRFRRRLEHFLPKRFHWNSDDIHHLGYYWFDGPRGKDNQAK